MDEPHHKHLVSLDELETVALHRPAPHPTTY